MGIALQFEGSSKGLGYCGENTFVRRLAKWRVRVQRHTSVFLNVIAEELLAREDWYNRSSAPD